MKRLLILAPLLLLAACDAFVQPVVSTVALPDELKDCTFFVVKPSKDAARMNVVRCPNSTTAATYSVGKSTQTTVTIDAPVTTPGPVPAASAALLEKVSKAADEADARKAARRRALEKLTEADMKALGLL